jgi:hypothetical protein
LDTSKNPWFLYERWMQVNLKPPPLLAALDGVDVVSILALVEAVHAGKHRPAPSHYGEFVVR